MGVGSPRRTNSQVHTMAAALPEERPDLRERLCGAGRAEVPLCLGREDGVQVVIAEEAPVAVRVGSEGGLRGHSRCGEAGGDRWGRASTVLRQAVRILTPRNSETPRLLRGPRWGGQGRLGRGGTR